MACGGAASSAKARFCGGTTGRHWSGSLAAVAGGTRLLLAAELQRPLPSSRSLLELATTARGRGVAAPGSSIAASLARLELGGLKLRPPRAVEHGGARVAQ
jgi:hypothetical protein